MLVYEPVSDTRLLRSCQYHVPSWNRLASFLLPLSVQNEKKVKMVQGRVRDRLFIWDASYFPSQWSCSSHPFSKTVPRRPNLLVGYSEINLFSLDIYAFKANVKFNALVSNKWVAWKSSFASRPETSASGRYISHKSMLPSRAG